MVVVVPLLALGLPGELPQPAVQGIEEHLLQGLVLPLGPLDHHLGPPWVWALVVRLHLSGLREHLVHHLGPDLARVVAVLLDIGLPGVPAGVPSGVPLGVPAGVLDSIPPVGPLGTGLDWWCPD